MQEQTELGLEAVRVALVDGKDAQSQIRAVARATLDFLTADPRRGALLLGSRGSEVLQRARVDSARALAEAMSAIAAVEMGSAALSHPDSELATYALVSGAMELIEAWLRGNFEVNREHFADLIAGLLAATPAITATLPNPGASA